MRQANRGYHRTKPEHWHVTTITVTGLQDWTLIHLIVLEHKSSLLMCPASPETNTRLPRQQRLFPVHSHNNVRLINWRGGDKSLCRGRHDSRLAKAHDTCADSSCLGGEDIKSQRFVALVFLGRDAVKHCWHLAVGGGFMSSSCVWCSGQTAE